MGTVKRETFEAARRRLLAHLASHGWAVKSALKVPNARRDGETLYFRPQAVYLNAHSLWIDIRGMSEADFVGTVERWLTHNRVMNPTEASHGS